MSLVLRLGLLAAIAYAVSVQPQEEGTLRSEAAGLVAPAVTSPRPELLGSRARQPSPPSPDPWRPAVRQGRVSPYWRLHRKFVRLQHEAGRLGDEVRLLRRQVRFRMVQASRGSAYAIRLASSAFGVDEGEMRTVASCETGGTFDPTAKNPSSSASGLFQFLDSTWASQGLAGFSVWDPIANALAAARIVAEEGWRQWSCRP